MSKIYPGPRDFVPKAQDHPLFHGLKGRIFVNDPPLEYAGQVETMTTHRMIPKIRYDTHKYRRVDGILSVIFPTTVEQNGMTYMGMAQQKLVQFGIYVEKTWKKIIRPEDLPDYAKWDLDNIVREDVDFPWIKKILESIPTEIEYFGYQFFDDDYFTNCGYDPYAMHGVTMSS